MENSASAEVQGVAVPNNDSSVITASELMQTAPVTGAADTGTAATGSGEQDAAASQASQPETQQTGNQETDLKWLGKRLNDERRKVERSNEYQLGKMLLEERMAQGMSAEEAFKAIQEERISAKAEQYQKDPKAFYADMVRQQMQMPAQNEASEAQQMSMQMQEAISNGSVPQGFDVSRDLTADVNGTPFFVLQQRYGLAAAFEIWKANSSARVNAQVQAQKRTPQPIQPSGNAAEPGQINYRGMDSKTFAEFKAKVDQATRDGRKVRI